MSLLKRIERAQEQTQKVDEIDGPNSSRLANIRRERRLGSGGCHKWDGWTHSMLLESIDASKQVGTMSDDELSRCASLLDMERNLARTEGLTPLWVYYGELWWSVEQEQRIRKIPKPVQVPRPVLVSAPVPVWKEHVIFDDNMSKYLKPLSPKRHKNRWVRRAIGDERRVRAFLKSGGLCAHCHTDAIDHFHIDHIIPVSRGGTDDLDNLQILCDRCNSKKGNRFVG